jgi:hypothetical protein
VSETKVQEPQIAFADDLPVDHLPEPAALTPEQIAARKQAEEQARLRQADWDEIAQALTDDAMSVTRFIGRWHPCEGDRERHVERVLGRELAR